MQKAASSLRNGRADTTRRTPRPVTMTMDFSFVAKNNEPLSNAYKALQ
jgi:hypothetical protein